MDDATLTRKVETELFRSRTVVKGKIDVNCADGIVWLRGEAKTPRQINQLEAKAAAIPEVKRVENLLHLPKTPAPTRTDTPAGQRKTRRGPAKPKAAHAQAAARSSGGQPNRMTAGSGACRRSPRPRSSLKAGRAGSPRRWARGAGRGPPGGAAGSSGDPAARSNRAAGVSSGARGVSIGARGVSSGSRGGSGRATGGSSRCTGGSGRPTGARGRPAAGSGRAPGLRDRDDPGVGPGPAPAGPARAAAGPSCRPAGAPRTSGRPPLRAG